MTSKTDPGGADAPVAAPASSAAGVSANVSANVSAASVSTANVSTANVSTANASAANASAANASAANVSAADGAAPAAHGVSYPFGRVPLRRAARRKKWAWADAYHDILTLSWPKFFLVIISAYLAVNLLFALAFFAVPGAVANARPGSFLDVFFFSIETLATVGYGFMNPGNTYGHVVASTEILLGMLGVAVATGLFFARFSRPTARILFSDAVVITGFNGVPTLMLRTANERDNLILEASVHLSLVQRERSQEGQYFSRIYDLKLERERTSVFALTWTVMHKIDASSPLYGKTHEQLLRDQVVLTAAIAGVDDTLHDDVHARRSYGAEQLHFGKRFVDIIYDGADGGRVVDLSRFHEIQADGS
jgi:inward rectifier potassium channel